MCPDIHQIGRLGQIKEQKKCCYCHELFSPRTYKQHFCSEHHSHLYAYYKKRVVEIYYDTPKMTDELLSFMKLGIDYKFPKGFVKDEKMWKTEDE